MYKVWLGTVDLERPNETPARRIARLQSELSAVFCALWTAHTQRTQPPGSRAPKSDPKLHTATSINQFLDDWKDC
eukprot:4673345-Pyramimonas_sp.AAC.1